MEKIKFKNLSNWLKVAIVGGWITIFIYALSFLIGFGIGIIGEL